MLPRDYTSDKRKHVTTCDSDKPFWLDREDLLAEVRHDVRTTGGSSCIYVQRSSSCRGSACCCSAQRVAMCWLWKRDRNATGSPATLAPMCIILIARYIIYVYTIMMFWMGLLCPLVKIMQITGKVQRPPFQLSTRSLMNRYFIWMHSVC